MEIPFSWSCNETVQSLKMLWGTFHLSPHEKYSYHIALINIHYLYNIYMRALVFLKPELASHKLCIRRYIHWSQYKIAVKCACNDYVIIIMIRCWLWKPTVQRNQTYSAKMHGWLCNGTRSNEISVRYHVVRDNRMTRFY